VRLTGSEAWSGDARLALHVAITRIMSGLSTAGGRLRSARRVGEEVGS
jgi:hypothetical protein